jgi:hypothetical protein
MKNISASIRTKLLNYARKDQISFQRVLTLYIQEGLLHRIVMSKYGNDITLKGGLMFYQLQGNHRINCRIKSVLMQEPFFIV